MRMVPQYFREDKNVVITSYGHDRTIDKISVSLFDSLSDGDQNIENYCDTINNLELKDNNWVYARLISQNTPYFLHTFIPLQFLDIIQKLDDRALEKVIRETDFNVLVKALKNEKEDIQSKIFARMTKRASSMLKEDMECIGFIGQKDSEKAKNEILFIIRRLIECGEILSPYKDCEEKEADS
jgi:flagellar motor switch protein FliG